MPVLNPGQYSLAASATGFATAKFERLTLEVSQTRSLEIQLQPSAVVETIQVNDNHRRQALGLSDRDQKKLRRSLLE